jgi:hypothetical protein
VRDVAERMHCPPDFVAVPLLVAYFSDRGRLLQIDRSRRFSVIVADEGTRE